MLNNIDDTIRLIYRIILKEDFDSEIPRDIEGFKIIKEDDKSISISFDSYVQKINKMNYDNESLLYIFAVSTVLTGDFVKVNRALKLLDLTKDINGNILNFDISDISSVSHLMKLLEIDTVSVFNKENANFSSLFKISLITGYITYMPEMIPGHKIYMVENWNQAIKIANKYNPLLIANFAGKGNI